MESAVRAFGRRAERDTDIAGTPIPGARACWPCSRRRIAMTVSGAILTVSTSREMLPVNSASGTESMRAQGRVWHGWRPKRCCAHCFDMLTTFELDGAPELALNNVIRRFERLPLRLIPKAKVASY